MNDHKMLERILDEVKEVKTEVKEIKQQVQRINGRVTKLETDSSWRDKHLSWITSIALVVAGFISKVGIDWIVGQI